MGLFNRGPEETVKLKVQGMSCGHCEMRVATALKGVDGVKDASADHQAGQATVTLKAGQTVDRGVLAAAVKAAGYEPVE